ncbi:MAG: DUF1294 domain-containing protein [Brevundimonas sp.]|nr:MAG: DUF1294 domain-containing protein [Brevundimonas sp.]
MTGLSLIDRLLIVLAVFQLGAFGLFWFDKTQARNGEWRVRERTLLLITLLGGFGAWLAQHLLRHKTRKEPFRTLMGVALGLHLIAVGVGIWWVLK